jgi:hypothetical protein
MGHEQRSRDHVGDEQQPTAERERNPMRALARVLAASAKA